MKKLSITMSCVLFLLLLNFIAAPAWADKITDWKKLAKLNKTFAPYGSQSSATHDDTFFSGWKRWRDEFAPFAETFRKTYGANREDLQKAFEGVSAPEGIYVYPAHMVELLTMDLDAHQKKIAAWLVKDGDDVFRRWESMKNPAKEKLELKADYAARALRKYTQANELDPAVGADAVSKAEKAVKESQSALQKAMAELKWPGHNPDFNGPGDPDDLAAEALKLLRKMAADGKQWSKPEYDDTHLPIAACVVGTKWNVWKKAPITHAPTQFSLKFFVAFKGEKHPDIAYGYYMFFYTDEKSGVKMAPPFYYCNSEQYAKFKMLRENVPGGAGGSSSASSGAVALIFRILLSLLLIGGGVIAWNDFLRSKLPQLSNLYNLLQANKNILGLSLLMVGVLALLRTVVLSFAPLADILPQLAALALGLTLISVKTLAETLGNEKAQKTLTKLGPIGDALTPHQVLLGQIALALGLIHLMIGGVILF